MQDRSLLDYWLILYERRFVIYLVVVTSIVSALLIGETVPPIYEARASLYIPAKLGTVSYVTGDSGSTLARQQNAPIAKEEDYKPYQGILKSLQLAQIVNARYPQKAVIKLLRSDVDFEVTDELIVRVYSRDPDPVLAADVANAYVDGLNQILEGSSQAQVAREPAYIKSALAGIQRELRDAEAELKRFEQEHHLASLDTELAALSAEKTTLQEKRDDTSAQIAASSGKQQALVQEIKREGRDLEVSEVATTSPLIENLRGQLAAQLTRIAELEAELGKNNLQIIAQRNRKQELEQQLGDEIKRWLSSRIKPGSSHLEALRQQLIDVVIEKQRLEAMSQAHAQSLARVNERQRAYPAIKSRWTELNNNVERLQDLQKKLRSNVTEAGLQAAREMHMVVPLDRAEPPQRPAFPIWWLNTLIALLAGILAGVGYAFFLNYVEMTRSVRTLRLLRAILGRG
jgi:succinoglycan biosynthesis transport protein ExoP